MTTATVSASATPAQAPPPAARRPVGVGDRSGTSASFEMVTTSYRTDTGADAYDRSAWHYAGHPEPAGGAYVVNVARKAALSPDGGRLYVAGYSGPAVAGSPVFVWAGPYFHNNFPLDAVALAYDTATMDLAWTGRFNTSPVMADVNVPVSLAVAHDASRVYLGSFLEYRVGEEYVDPDRLETKNFYDYLVHAYDA